MGLVGPTLPSQRGVLAIAALVLALPLLHLVPLPAGIWHALPGRGTEVAALRLVGAESGWMPLSQSPARTLAALLAIVPAVGLLLLTAQCTLDQRVRLLWVLVGGALASVVLGTLQLADGESTQWRLQAETHLGWLTGFQASRNAQADVLSIALTAIAALGATLLARRQSGQGDSLQRVILALAFLLILFGAVMTGSRMGIALLAAVLAAIAILGFLALRRSGHPVAKIGPAAGVTGVALIGLVGLALARVPELQRVASRFVSDGDDRAKLWADTHAAVAQSWPAGSGLGTFQPAFIAVERLEFVDPSVPVRAHNDWLEFTLEAGLPGWLVIAAIAAVLALAWWRAVSAVRRERRPAGRILAAQIAFGTVALGVLALHSLVDYPLRSMSLACFAAVAAAMLFLPPDWTDSPGSEPDSSDPR